MNHVIAKELSGLTLGELGLMADDLRSKEASGTIDDKDREILAATEELIEGGVRQGRNSRETAEMNRKYRAGMIGPNDGAAAGGFTFTDGFLGHDPLAVERRVGSAKAGGFKSPSAFLEQVLFAGVNKKVPRTLAPFQFMASAGSDEQSGYSKPYGAFLIPESWSNEVMRRSVAPMQNPILDRVREITLPQPVLNVPCRVDAAHATSVTGGLRCYRRAETDTVPPSRIKLENVRLEATSLFGVTHSTRELLEASAGTFIDLLASSFEEEFNSHLQSEFLNGTGAGQPLGVMNCPAKIAVAAEDGQGADTIISENVFQMRSQAWNYSRAFWMANPDTLPSLLTMNVSVGTGGNLIWIPAGQEDRPDTLLGRPIFFSELCKTRGDEGDVMLLNMDEYLHGVWRPLRGESSMFVRWEEHEQSFKFWIENDGRPWWKAPLTPKNSAVEISPFVTLAAR